MNKIKKHNKNYSKDGNYDITYSKFCKSKGITLVALIITIIIMLILAGITLNLTLGNGGLFSRAKNVTEKWKEAEIKEKEDLRKITNEMKINKEKIDILPPKMFIPIISTTDNSITIEAFTTDCEETDESSSSGIGGYSFSKDNGLNWTEYQENGKYIFNELIPGETYIIKVRVRDKSANETVSAGISKRIGIQLFPNNVTFSILYYAHSTTNVGSGTVTSTKTTMSRTSCSGSKCEVYFRTIYDLTGYSKIYFTYTQNNYIALTDNPPKIKIEGRETNEHRTAGTYTEYLDILSMNGNKTIEILSTYWNFYVNKVWLE